MKHFNSLRKAEKFLRTYQPKYVTEDKSDWGIFHKKSSKTWWVGSYIEWLNK